MDYLNTNLECLRKKNNNIYNYFIDKLTDLDFVKFYKDKYKIVYAKDGMRILEVYVDNNRIRLNSVYSPVKEAERWGAKYNNIGRITSVIMCGYGVGYFFYELEKYIDDSAIIFDYEPDIALFLFIMENFDISSFLSDRRVLLFVDGINDKDMYIDICRRINWAMLPTQVIVYHPVYDKLFKDRYEWFRDISGKCRYALELAGNTSMHHAKEFTANAIRNIQFIKNSNYIGDFIDKIDKDVPIIIVSAGPSLNKNVDDLKKAENRAFILATDTAVRFLIEHDVYFDVIVSIDGSKPVEFLSDKKCIEKCIFTIPDANTEILNKNCGRKVWLNGAGYLENLYNKYGFEFPEYTSGGSVATAAFWIAKILKSDTIIFVGQDLAYDGKNTHAGSTVDIEEICDKDTYIDGINGEKIRTRWDWLRYLHWFENAISGLDENVKVIDATEGGAKISGTKIMKLSEAIEKYCVQKFDFEKIINDMKTDFTEKDYKSLHLDVLDMEKQLDYIYEKAKKGESSAEKIQTMIVNNKIDSQEINLLIEKIKDTKECIQVKKIYMMLDEYISVDIVDYLNKSSKTYKNDVQEIYDITESNIALFRALKKAVKDLKPLVSDLLNEI